MYDKKYLWMKCVAKEKNVLSIVRNKKFQVNILYVG